MGKFRVMWNGGNRSQNRTTDTEEFQMAARLPLERRTDEPFGAPACPRTRFHWLLPDIALSTPGESSRARPALSRRSFQPEMASCKAGSQTCNACQRRAPGGRHPPPWRPPSQRSLLCNIWHQSPGLRTDRGTAGRARTFPHRTVLPLACLGYLFNVRSPSR